MGNGISTGEVNRVDKTYTEVNDMIGFLLYNKYKLTEEVFL